MNKPFAIATAATKVGPSRKDDPATDGASRHRACTTSDMAKKTTKGSKRKAAKRTLIDTGTDKRFVRRAAAGAFRESDDVGKSLSADRLRKAKTKVKSGQGDRGDR